MGCLLVLCPQALLPRFCFLFSHYHNDCSYRISPLSPSWWIPNILCFFIIIYFILLFISQLFHHLDHVNCPFFFSTTSFLRCGDQNDSPQSRCKHINVLSGKVSLSFLFPVAYVIMKFCWVVLFLFFFFSITTACQRNDFRQQRAQDLLHELRTIFKVSAGENLQWKVKWLSLCHCRTRHISECLSSCFLLHHQVTLASCELNNSSCLSSFPCNLFSDLSLLLNYKK